jgi:hypothetical protein
VAEPWVKYANASTSEDGPWSKYGGGQSSAPPADTSTQEPAERPGFFKRLGQSIGLPGSKEEVSGLLDRVNPLKHPESVGNPGVFAVGTLAEGVGNAVKDKLKSAASETGEAIKNVAQGGDVLPNVAKAAYSALPDVLQGYGEDINNKNYAGALGTATGVMGQAALAKLLPNADVPNVKEAFSKGAVTKSMASELHGALDRVATDAGLPVSKAESLSAKTADVVKGLKSQAQSIYGDLDKASGGRYQRFRDEIDLREAASRDRYLDPDAAARNAEKLNEVKQAYADVQQELVNQGVDPATIKAADAKWAQAKALETVGKQFKKGESLSGNLRPGTPAVDTGLKNLKDHILPQATKGEAGAIRESVTNATEQVRKAKRNQKIAAGVAGALGVGTAGKYAIDALSGR